MSIKSGKKVKKSILGYDKENVKSETERKNLNKAKLIQKEEKA